MTSTQPIYIEADDAMHRRECAPGSRLEAVGLANCQPWASPSQQMAANIAYWQACEGSRSSGAHVLSLSSGTFCYPGRIEGKDSQHPAMIGADADTLVDWYEQGCIDFRHRTNFPAAGWVGSEFENTRLCFDMIRDAGIDEVIAYLNWEWVLDIWSQSDPLQHEVISRLLGSARFRNRLPNPVRNWSPTRLRAAIASFGPDFDVAWPAIHGTLRLCANRSASQWLRAAGHTGRFIVSNSAAPSRPCIRFDGRIQPSSEMQPGQINHMGWYLIRDLDDADKRVRLATWAAMSPRSFDASQTVFHHFTLDEPIENAVRGVQAVAPSPCVVFGSTLNQLAAFAGAIGA